MGSSGDQGTSSYLSEKNHCGYSVMIMERRRSEWV